MIVLISSASLMGCTSAVQPPELTVPRFQEQADDIAKIMVQYSSADLAHILKINSKLANESYYRFQGYFLEDIPSLQAISAYTGIVYKNIACDSFTPQDFLFAQQTLRIASFMYGLLAPLDAIKLYRMEPFVELSALTDGNMYRYWQENVTKALLHDISCSGNTLVNLASASNFKLFKHKPDINVRLITPLFKISKDGKSPTPVVYIKMARGQMVRYIIKNKITDPEQLKHFDWGGFTYHPELSDSNQWVFYNG